MSNDHKPTYLTSELLLTNPDSDQLATINTHLAEDNQWSLDSFQNEITYINTENTTISISQVRDLIAEIAYAPALGKRRAIVLLFAEKLSLPSQHSILKSIEESPENTQFFLVTAQPNQLLDTIKSRCKLIDLRSVEKNSTDETIQSHISTLKKIQKKPFSTWIDIATTYKSKDDAIQFLKKMVTHLHDSSVDLSLKTASITEMTVALEKIQANHNPQLTLEHCFFSIKNQISK